MLAPSLAFDLRRSTRVSKNSCASKKTSMAVSTLSYDDELAKDVNRAVVRKSFVRPDKLCPAFRQQAGVFCQRSTLHGLSDVYRADNLWLRLFWLSTFMGALAAAVFGCYHILEQYLASPVVVSYFVQESEMTFALPDLIVCPFNRFNGEFLRKHEIDAEVAQYMQLQFGAQAKHPAQRRELYTYFNITRLLLLEKAMYATLDRLNMTFEQFLDAASLKCTDIFVDCTGPDGGYPCCENVTSLLTFAGKCYRIKGTNQSGPGYSYGMAVLVSLPKRLYNVSVNNWLNDGILLKLAEPDQGIDYDMTFVPVGTHALMPLKATRYEFIHDPPRFVCLEEPELKYSRVDCFDSCYLKAAQKACNCALPLYYNRTTLRLCTTNQFFFCIRPHLERQFNASTNYQSYFHECRKQCKPRCTYWQYHSSISYSKFPSDEARVFAQNETEWLDMKNSIIIDLYYEKLEFTKIKHYRAMTVHGFIANLGGQYSLWLGGSILTLMQMVVFITNYAYSCCCGKHSKHGDVRNGDIRKQSSASRLVVSASGAAYSGQCRSGSTCATAASRTSTFSSDNDLHPQLMSHRTRLPSSLTTTVLDDGQNSSCHMANGNLPNGPSVPCDDADGCSGGQLNCVNSYDWTPLRQSSSINDGCQLNNVETDRRQRHKQHRKKRPKLEVT